MLQYRNGKCDGPCKQEDVAIVKRLPSGNYCDSCNKKRLEESKEGYAPTQSKKKLTAYQIYQKKISDNLSDEEYKNLLVENGVVIKKSSITPKQRIPSGEGALFRAIAATRPLVSFVSGEPLNQWEIETCKVFCHLLSKAQNKYPKFKNYDKNIVLLTWEEHQKLDHGTEAQRVGPGWDRLRLLKQELLEEYKRMEQLDIEI